MKYYCEDSQQVLQELNSQKSGLTEKEAAERLLQNGANELKAAKGKSLLRRFAEQVADPMIVILLAAAAISGVLAVLENDSFADVIIILAVVLINAVLGVYQESKAEKAIEALQDMAAATSKVVRDGKMSSILSKDLVVGDIICLEAGDAVPADARILESASLKAEEAALTGESVPVTKLIDQIFLADGERDVPLGDRKNMVYMGSTIVYGRAVAVVTATGMDTEMGKIADALSQAQEGQTPLQRKLTQLSKVLTKLVIGICVLVFAIQMIRAGSLNFEVALNSFMIAVSLAVAAIPEGLAAVVTVVLSIGVTNMSKRNAIIRRLTAVETLGCAQVICSDKTGTLTQNQMTVVDSFGVKEQELSAAMALCSDAELDAEGNVTYTPTEGMQLRGWVSSSTQTYAVDNGISYIPTGGVEYALYEDHAEITKWTNNTWSISIPAQIEGLPVTVIGNGAFKGLNNLEDVYFPSTLQEIGSCAFMNSSARDMQIPGSVERIGSHAFYQSRYSNYLTAEFVILGDGILYQYNGTANEVTIPSNVRHIGEDVFAYHREITDVSIPDSVTEICGGAFYQCSTLTKLELPDYVERVAVGAFTGCSALKTVAFGSGIQEVDANTFCDCTELAALYGYAGTYIETFAQEHGYYFEAYSEPEQEEPISAEESIIHEEAAE